MNIKFLGRWSSNLVKGERNVSFVLDDKVVFDFGPHTLESLLERKIDPLKVTTVLITHMHLDHYAGVAELLWYRSIYKARNRLTVFGPKGIKKNTGRLLRLLNTPPEWFDQQIDVRTDFIEDAETGTVRIFRANHAIPCNSYRVRHRGKVIFYSGDTGYSSEVVKGANRADLLIHELTYTDRDRESADHWGHSTWSDAIRVFEESGAKRLIPVHMTSLSRAFVLRNIGRVDGMTYPADTITF